MIVVIGAGLIGLGIAYELALRGAAVRVLDAGEASHGASWAGAGMLAPYTESLASPAFEALCVESLAAYPAFVAGLHERGGVDARLRLDGILDAAFDPAALRERERHVAALRARGVDARLLSREEARALEPSLGEGVAGGSLIAAEGHVDNRRLGRALYAACAALGVRIETQAGFVALETDPRRVLGVRGPLGFIPAQTVVNAAGAWAGQLAGVPARARVPVVPVKGQMLALAMPRGFVRRTTWLPGAYLVPRDDGRLLVGATVEHAGFDARVTAGATRALLDAALQAMPALAELAVVEQWTGLRPGSPDELPFLGATSLEGYVVAAGHYRNGILLAPATAAAIADLLEGRDVPALAAFSPQRPQEGFARTANEVA